MTQINQSGAGEENLSEKSGSYQDKYMDQRRGQREILERQGENVSKETSADSYESDILGSDEVNAGCGCQMPQESVSVASDADKAGVQDESASAEGQISSRRGRRAARKERLAAMQSRAVAKRLRRERRLLRLQRVNGENGVAVGESLSDEVLQQEDIKVNDSADAAVQVLPEETEAASGSDDIREKIRKIFEFIKEKSLVFWDLVKRFAQTNRRSTVILFFTLVPALFTFLYTALIYDSMYVSKTTFTIQSNTVEKSFDFGAASMLTAGVNKDLHVVYAYIKSLDLFNELDQELNLKEHYQHHDPVSSMPSDPTLTDTEEFWDDVTSVKIDADSEIMQMTVRTYDPEYSKLLADRILSKVDNLVNTMNAHALEDSIKLAKREVKEAEDRVKDLAEKIRVYRDEHEYIDPKTEAGSTMGIISSLESDIAQKKAELSEKLGYMRSNSQEIVTLKRKIESLEKQVKELRSRIASSGNIMDQKRMSKSVGEYEKLELEYQFAQKILDSVRTSLEVTRQQSLSKNKYLVKIDEPKVPDESLWPRPFKAACVVMAISFLLILGVSLIISAVMEHLGI
jgi:capsular polysaccharide transport system permease protein